MKQILTWMLLLFPMWMTAQQKKEFIPVDWELVKKEATENPERIKELVARFSMQKKGEPLTDTEKILAFYGQSYLTNDKEDDLYMFEMYDLRKAGKNEECLALTRKMLEINPLNLDALTTAYHILFSMAKDSTRSEKIDMNEAWSYNARSRFIFRTMLMTGDGSAEHPIDVTKISDEYNFMRHYLDIWKIKMQEFDGKCDIITLDGKSMRYDRPQIYFNTKRVSELISSKSKKNNTPKKETSTPTKDSVLILINGEECRDISWDFIANGTGEDYEKFLNSRNLSLERIDIWKNEKKKDQFRQKFGNWVKEVVEIKARNIISHEGNPTENPRGIYKLMAIKGRQELNPYPHDIYKICTDNITMRMNVVKDYYSRVFRIDHSDPEVFYYTGEKSELDETDKSIRIFDSNAKHFTQKWWCTYRDSHYFPYNTWCYEFYESGKYSETARPIADMLTSAPTRDANNPLIGTWQYAMKIEKIAEEGSKNWIDELKKVDNMKDILDYFRQTEPKNDFEEYYVFTPSFQFMMGMKNKSQGMIGSYEKITYKGKDAIVSPRGEEMEIHWLTDDMIAFKFQVRNKDLYRIWERVKDERTMLDCVENWFLSK